MEASTNMFDPNLVDWARATVSVEYRLQMTVLVMLNFVPFIGIGNILSAYGLVMCLTAIILLHNLGYGIIMMLWFMQTKAVYHVCKVFVRYPNIEALLEAGHQPKIKTIDSHVEEKANQMLQGKSKMTKSMFSCPWWETYAYMQYVMDQIDHFTYKEYKMKEEKKWSSKLLVCMHSNMNRNWHLVVLGYACCLAAQDARSLAKFSAGKAVDNVKAMFADPKVSSEMANAASEKLAKAKKKASRVVWKNCIENGMCTGKKAVK
jgi:hypothetical protein